MLCQFWFTVFCSLYILFNLLWAASHCVWLEVYMVMKIQVVIFWVVTTYSVVMRYQCFGGPGWSVHAEDEGNMVLQSIGILSHHYTVSQYRRPWFGRHFSLELAAVILFLKERVFLYSYCYKLNLIIMNFI